MYIGNLVTLMNNNNDSQGMRVLPSEKENRPQPARQTFWAPGRNGLYPWLLECRKLPSLSPPGWSPVQTSSRHTIPNRKRSFMVHFPYQTVSLLENKSKYIVYQRYVINVYIDPHSSLIHPIVPRFCP